MTWNVYITAGGKEYPAPRSPFGSILSVLEGLADNLETMVPVLDVTAIRIEAADDEEDYI